MKKIRIFMLLMSLSLITNYITAQSPYYNTDGQGVLKPKGQEDAWHSLIGDALEILTGTTDFNTKYKNEAIAVWEDFGGSIKKKGFDWGNVFKGVLEGFEAGGAYGAIAGAAAGAAKSAATADEEIEADPTHDAVNSKINAQNLVNNLKAWTKQAEQMAQAEQMNIDLQNARQLRANMQAISQLGSLVDATAKLKSEFNYYVGLNTEFDNHCYMNFKRVNMLAKTQEEYIEKIIKGDPKQYFYMSSGDRAKFVKESQDVFLEAIKDMEEFNAVASQMIKDKCATQYIKKYSNNPEVLGFCR